MIEWIVIIILALIIESHTRRIKVLEEKLK